MLKNIYSNTLLIICIVLLVISCSKDDPDPVHEHEVFTRVVLEVKKDGETDYKKYTFEICSD